MLEGTNNGKNKAKILESYGFTTLYQDTVGEWPIKIGFKYDYAVKNYYVDVHEKKYIIWYRWNFIDHYLLMEWCMFRWIHMTAGDSEQ